MYSHDFNKADGNYTLFYLNPGVLLPEMVTSMVLLQLKAPGVIHASRSVPVLEEILDILDTYNKLAPGLDRDDKEDLAWPGVWSKSEGSCKVGGVVYSQCWSFLFQWNVIWLRNEKCEILSFTSIFLIFLFLYIFFITYKKNLVFTKKQNKIFSSIWIFVVSCIYDHFI